MELETERLTLRPWKESDAEDLFQYASSPDVGPAAGWNAHASVEESRDVIKGLSDNRYLLNCVDLLCFLTLI